MISSRLLVANLCSLFCVGILLGCGGDSSGGAGGGDEENGASGLYIAALSGGTYALDGTTWVDDCMLGSPNFSYESLSFSGNTVTWREFHWTADCTGHSQVIDMEVQTWTLQGEKTATWVTFAGVPPELPSSVTVTMIDITSTSGDSWKSVKFVDDTASSEVMYGDIGLSSSYDADGYPDEVSANGDLLRVNWSF